MKEGEIGGGGGGGVYQNAQLGGEKLADGVIMGWLRLSFGVIVYIDADDGLRDIDAIFALVTKRTSMAIRLVTTTLQSSVIKGQLRAFLGL